MNSQKLPKRIADESIYGPPEPMTGRPAIEIRELATLPTGQRVVEIVPVYPPQQPQPCLDISQNKT